MNHPDLLTLFQKHLRACEQNRKYRQQFTKAEEQHIIRVVAQILEQPQRSEQWILEQFTREERP